MLHPQSEILLHKVSAIYYTKYSTILLYRTIQKESALSC